MNESSDNHPKRIPPPISIAVPSNGPSAAEPEPMVISSPLNLAPPASPNPTSRGPRSPSLSPIRKWRRRWSHNMHSVLAPCSCGSRDEDPTLSMMDEEQEFPVVRMEPRKRPTALVPVNAGNVERPEILQYAPSSTHLHSLLIRRTQCFLVSADKAVKHGAHSRKLGICVMFQERTCSTADCSSKCPECKVCPHLFKCNCVVKFMGTSWCPHLHIMQELTSGIYLIEGLMFIHDNWKFTEMRHLRAFIQGKTKMRRLKVGMWVEEFERMMRSQIYRVKEQPETNCTCPEDKVCPLCDACLCKYACTCEDYSVDKQVCQHIHNVAMQKHERCEELFAELEEFGSDNRDLAGKNEDPNIRYYIEQEHEMSFYFDISTIEKRVRQLPHPTEWHMSFCGDDPSAIVVKKNVLLAQQCYCHTEAATKANSCVRCQICDKHYACNCSTAQFTICRHIHAVVRLESSRTETPEQRFEYLQSLISREQSQDSSEFEGPIRSPLGPKNRLTKQLVRQFSFSVESLFFQHSNVEL